MKKLHVYLILFGCQSQSIDGCSQFEKCHKKPENCKKAKKDLEKIFVTCIRKKRLFACPFESLGAVIQFVAFFRE